MALTDTAIRKATPTEKAYKISDGRGLFLLVTPAGGKLWRWKYCFEGKEKLMPLGKYPQVGLAEVRERHAAESRLLASGVDPMAQRKDERDAKKEAILRASGQRSFRTIAELWLEHWGTDKSAQHVGITRRRLEKDVLPVLGNRPIDEIEAAELVSLVKFVEERGVADLAKRLLQTCGQIFRYAIAHGYAMRNPVADFRPADVLKPHKKINMARIDVQELPVLLRAIETYRGRVVTRLAMKLLALTFVRTSELIEAHWSEIDFEAHRWNIPAERMKMALPHIVPLSDQAIEVLELLRPLSGTSELVLPSERSVKRPMSNMTILMALKRMGYKRQMTGHGFRGLASTILHEQGYAHEHIELQLAHAPRNAVSAAYNQALYLEPRAKMMQDWADYLEKTQRGGKLLPFTHQAVVA
ncbi:tyrosine-type recombinase/integrase [Telmatobacter bradus]|uniref:tyrosine-type recombinase/integrase n=1 Tax=Telmatobacter bradus TaxID=474953 RepID=UPI003B43B60C